MPDKLIIKGGRPLEGKVEVRGSKNVASKLMIASLLTEEPCLIENVPVSLETEITKELCETIGGNVAIDKNRRCRIETRVVNNSIITQFSRRNRIPILALGPLLHRRGFAEVPVLGGCPIGHRPINFHVEALRKMGVKIERKEHSYYAEASEICGAEIEFPFPSVGATENVILAATLANGRTVIRNAAIEPEVFDLIMMLRSMGARIFCKENSRRIEIEGVSRLGGVTYRVMPDRNEVVSIAAAALATGGDVLIRDTGRTHIGSFLTKIDELGGGYEKRQEGMRFFARGPFRAAVIETAPHPGFMTDWQQPFCILLTQAKGQSIIHETVYEDRLGYAQDLNRMGAKIETTDECLGSNQCRFNGQTFNHSVRITGPTKLFGSELTMTDVRAGMAHIIAALVAEGESVISGVEHIDRGYERIDERLRELGADIKRISKS